VYKDQTECIMNNHNPTFHHKYVLITAHTAPHSTTKAPPHQNKRRQQDFDSKTHYRRFLVTEFSKLGQMLDFRVFDADDESGRSLNYKDLLGSAQAVHHSHTEHNHSAGTASHCIRMVHIVQLQHHTLNPLLVFHRRVTITSLYFQTSFRSYPTCCWPLMERVRSLSRAARKPPSASTSLSHRGSHSTLSISQQSIAKHRTALRKTPW
jgi:hypothetical protein